MTQHIRGVLVWSFALAAIGLFLQSIADSHSWSDWLDRYQTLATGILALAGALLAYAGIREQVDQTGLQYADRILRENYAARALLPTALSSLSDYAENCARGLVGLLPEDGDRQLVSKRLQVIPDVPDEIVSVLRDAIRLATEQNRKKLADLLAALQIQHARLRDYREWNAERPLVRLDLEHRVVDAVELHAGIAGTFDYARRTADTLAIPPAKEAIDTALKNCRIFDQPEIDKLVEDWKVEQSIFRFSVTSGAHR